MLEAKTLCPPAVSSIDEFVELINDWYEENHDRFKDKFDAAVAGVKPRPGDIADAVWKDWSQATIGTLTDFFGVWYKDFHPGLDTGLQMIQQFSWLYYQNPAGLEFVTTDPGRLMTFYFVDLNGRKMDSPESKVLVDEWLKELGDRMREYIVPEGGYQNFNQFFTRELKPGERPISGVNDDSVVVSPADAIVNMIDDDLSVDRPINVKTQKLNVRQLLDDSKFADRFEGGTAVSNILMPAVYHRYHAPVSGKVVESDEDVAGCYFGIDDFPKLLNGGNVGYGYDYSVFEQFRRGYLVIETEKYGYVAMIPVGLNTIASVVFEDKFKKVRTSDRPVNIYKGEEVGYFQYGGSLNILLFERGVFPAIRIPQGQIIGTMEEKTKPSMAQFRF